jgi:galactofuranosylgalactofuranosylrhamnosyl-N-acetylglucosaminyl-diphospho-decaprenol beta-1,5/1,6-galactofuranosyltransferase
MITLQSIILRDPSLSSLPLELYLRTNNFSEWDLNSGCNLLFNTFFNLVHVEKLKSSCAISDIFLKVKGSGHFEIVVWGSNDLQTNKEKLDHFVFEKKTEEFVVHPLSFWKDCTCKFIYLEIKALDKSKISSLSFTTDTPVVNNVRMGATIVHFNRKNWVLPALKRLQSGLLNDPEYAEKISLVVVDNSQNISVEEACGVTIIRNKNLGGSGGFTRGLLHFKDHHFTHCLFMDDDASCEVESLKRTWALLAYSKISSFAVAGSLLLEESPSIIYEKGAVFEDVHKALFGGFDMVHPADLYEVEKELPKPNYGGWWFFAFKIDDASYFPFPFFVRGDDLMFSLINKFNIYTTNGIGCWGDDFATKSTPLSCYLDARSSLLNNIICGEKSVTRSLIFLSKHFVLHLLSFNYASVRAIRTSLSDTGLGSHFWKDNLDTVRIREKISSFSSDERMLPLNLSNFSYDICPLPAHRYVKGIKPSIGIDVYVKAALLNGVFLPDFLMKKKYLLIPKGKYGGLKYAFRYNKIIYYDDKTSMGYIAKLERKILLIECFKYLSVCLKILFKNRKYRDNLNEAVQLYTKESFWRSVYQEEI